MVGQDAHQIKFRQAHLQIGLYKHALQHTGTAGIWRIQAIKDAGGWKDRTTVEDMDLAVRASLKGWEFVFVGDVTVSYPLLTNIFGTILCLSLIIYINHPILMRKIFVAN